LPAWRAGHPDHGATRGIPLSLGVPAHGHTRSGQGRLTMGALGQSMLAEDGRKPFTVVIHRASLKQTPDGKKVWEWGA
jgi:hypothetical protein